MVDWSSLLDVAVIVGVVLEGEVFVQGRAAGQRLGAWV